MGFNEILMAIPSGEHTKSHGKSPFLMGKSTISMAIFNCYVNQRVSDVSEQIIIIHRPEYLSHKRG